MYYQLYLITNSVNNKRYIGQCNQAKGYITRFKEHISESTKNNVKRISVLHRAIKKYGSENFNVKLLLHDIPEKDIDKLESVWIQKFNTFYLNGFGYNMTYGGQGVHGYKHTESTKHKLSLLNNKYSPSPEVIQKAKETKRKNNWYEYRKLHTDWRKNLSISMKKRFETEPGTWTGRKHSEETKLKLSKLHGYPVVMLDINTEEEIKIFYSCIEATKYLIDIGKTKNKTANGRILSVCYGKAKTAYGYKWKFYSSVTTNPDECKDVE